MSPIKILLAEDDADDRQFFFDFVEERRDIILLPVAQDGEEVLAYLSKMTEPDHLPDFIILDQNMPRRSGLHTLQMLKEDDRYENIPAFIYSTYTDEGLRQRSLNAGARSVFLKPFTPEGYHTMIDKMLELLK